MAKRDLYEILGVSKTASADEIKRAYRKLAKQYHPDHNPDDSHAEKRFKEVQHAYSILKDKDQRAQYDRFGEVGVGDFRTDAAGQRVYTWGADGSQINVDDLESLFSAFGMGGTGRAHPFEQFFGGAGGGRRARSRRPVRGRDLQRRINLSLDQAVKGVSIELDLKSGPGGRGEKLSVTIPPGVEDGGKIRLAGKGSPGSNGGPPGDLFLICAVQAHKYFRREGRNIHLDVPITVAEAVLGTKLEVPTLDGPVTLTLPPGTSGGAKLRLKGKGVPAHGSQPAGDQYVIVRVVVPKSLNEEQTKLAEQFAGTLSDNPRAGLGW